MFTQLTKKKQNKKNKLTKDKLQDSNADIDGFIKTGCNSDSSPVPGGASVPSDGVGDGAESGSASEADGFASAKDGGVGAEKSSPAERERPSAASREERLP
ncbi:uncharacterized protein LOC111616430 [Centruroides sculpturatus]|uniref:uncharacterized protein LOC111616430 n=1 Tax=Centruroides sculpturatus TaxID=218467 RepID=UPI000C6EF80D|nr:uncharacterized protein LOC111616430 [Centruroides sculpturatus]